MTPFVRRVGSVEIEYWHAAHHACLACDEPSEIRLGDENEWLVYLCASCANNVGTALARIGRDIRASIRELFEPEKDDP